MRIALSGFCLLFSFHLLLGQQLVVDDGMAFSTTTGEESSVRNLLVINQGDKPLLIRELVLKGANAMQFNLRTATTFPITIAPGQQTSLIFSFKPKQAQPPGMVTAELVLLTNDPKQPQKTVMLRALVAKGLEGENEPSLHQVVKTLGYGLEVGGEQLSLGTDAAPSGDEMKASLFAKANPKQPVTMQPVARYSPKERVPFGYYYTNKRKKLRYLKVGTLSDVYREHQTLYPRLISGETTFDPKDRTFGLFTSTAAHATYTEAERNRGVPHAVRVYPLKDGQGKPLADSYLVCFEEAKNGDYQDFVFVLKNIKIVE